MSTLGLFCLCWTLGLYALCKRLYRRWSHLWLTPALVVPALTVALLLITGIPYSIYQLDTRWVLWLLGPATVAFAVPIYQYRGIIRRHWLALAIGVVAGMAMALLSAWLLARGLHFDETLSRSLLVRSISTPFALALSDHVGGSRQIVAILTVITGLVGMFVGDAVLALLRLRSTVAQGAAFGASAHGFGTARARERHDEEGVVASLTMVIAGVVMVLIGPPLVNGLIALFGAP